MFVTMYDAPGVGLAAPQVGVQKRFFVYDFDDEPGIIINPEIVESRRRVRRSTRAACRCPGCPGRSCGPNEIHVAGFDLDGNEVDLEADELAGRVFQHELDHLDGVLLRRAPRRRAAQGGPEGHPRAAHARHRAPARARGRRRAPAPPLSSVPDPSADPTGPDRRRSPSRPAPPPRLPRHARRGRAAAARPARRRLRHRRWSSPGPTSAAAGAATLSPSPVKAAALELGLPVTDDLDDVLDAGVELGVVVAFGRIIPPRVLEAVPDGEPALLAAAPLAGRGAGRAGDPGRRRHAPACASWRSRRASTPAPSTPSRRPPIGRRRHRSTSLRGRLVDDGHAAAGRRARRRARRAGAAGRASPPTPPRSTPASWQLDWSRPAVELDRLVRLGGAWTTFRGKRLKVWQADRSTAPTTRGLVGAAPGALDGTVVAAGDGCARAWSRCSPRARAARTAAGVAQRRPPGARRTARRVSAARRRPPGSSRVDALGAHRPRRRLRQPRPAADARAQRARRPRPGLRHRARLRHDPHAAGVRLARRPLPARPGRIDATARDAAAPRRLPAARSSARRPTPRWARPSRRRPRSGAGLVNAVLRKVGRPRRSTWPDDATRLSYPDWIVEPAHRRPRRTTTPSPRSRR